MRSTATSRRRRGDRDQQNSSTYLSTSYSPPCQASVKTAPAVKTTPVPRPEISVSQATAADHALIQHLVASCGMRLSPSEFQAQVDEPSYAPGQRLLARHRGTLAGHARLLDRRWQFGEVSLPVCELSDLVVLPEQQACRADVVLLQEAERLAQQSGAALMVARTSATRLLQQYGWIAGPRHSYSTIGARELSSAVRCIPAPPPSLLPDDSESSFELTVRLWRRIEQDALVRLYDTHCSRAYGAALRDENYWRWLITRGGFDRIYVAIDGPARLPAEQAADRILGYAVLREARVVECVAPPAREDILNQLLSRACDDALERDWHPLRIEAPPDHPVHALVTAAGGRMFHHDADEGQALMVKVFDVPEFVRQLSSEFMLRARCARLTLPIEFGLSCEGRAQRFVLSRRGARLSRGSLGRHSMTCSAEDWLRLLLGRTSATELTEAGRLRCSSRAHLQMLETLFPRLPLWLPTWDVLPALA